ncbi:membrane protein [Larkinella knui]
MFFYKVLIKWQLVDPSEAVRGTDLLLMGLCLLVMLMQLASIFVPANYVLALIWLLGAASVALGSFASVKTYLRRFVRQQKQIPLFWLFVGVVVLYSTLEPSNVDSGMYHLPSIRWYERFRVIPGLGNLHGRLAFNSSFLVTSAAFGFTDWAGQTLFPLNGLVFLVVCWRFLGQIRSATPIRFLALILLALIVYYLIRQVFSPTPDLWATLLPITIFMLWLEMRPVFSIRHVVLFMLVCLCITVKLATIPVALSLVPLAWAVRRQLTLRHVWCLGGFALLMVVPWLVRTTILSGYLLYPFPALDLFSFDWEIPLERVRFEKDFVEFWGKFRIAEPDFDPALLKTPASEWIPVWWHHKEYYALNKPVWLLAVCSPVVVIFQYLNPMFRTRVQPLVFPYLVALSGFLFWFLSAPEFRFGYCFVWMTAFLPLLPFIPDQTRYWNLRPWSNAVLAGLLVTLIGYYAVHFLGQERFPVQRYALLPKPLSYRNLTTEANFFRPYRTRSGLLILTPKESPLQQSCFDQELPCSPYSYPDLELRGATLADGFRSSGAVAQ